MLVLATRWPRVESGLWCNVCVCVCVCGVGVLGCGMSTLLQLPALFTSKKVGLHGFEGRVCLSKAFLVVSEISPSSSL